MRSLVPSTILFLGSIAILANGANLGEADAILFGGIASVISSVLWWLDAIRLGKKLNDSTSARARRPFSRFFKAVEKHAKKNVVTGAIAADSIPQMLEARLARARSSTQVAPPRPPFVVFQEKPEGPDAFSDLESLDALYSSLPKGQKRRLVITDIQGALETEVSLASVVSGENKLSHLLCHGIFPGLDLIPDARIDLSHGTSLLVDFLQDFRGSYDEVIVYLSEVKRSQWHQVVSQVNSKPELEKHSVRNVHAR